MATIKASPIGNDRQAFATEQAIRNEMRQVLQQAANKRAASYRKTWATWKHKPELQVDIAADSVEISVNDDVWNWLNAGTEAHEIRPRNARVLAFNGKFSPKTQPGVIGSGAGSSGGNKIFSRGVQHPGTKARNWTQAIEDKHDLDIQELVDAAIDRLTR